MIMPMFFDKFFQVFMFHFIHFLFIVFSASFQNMFDLRECNDREEFREQEKAGKEQAESPHIKSNLPDSRPVIGTPGAGQIIPVNRSDDYHKAFKPHTYIYQN